MASADRRFAPQIYDLKGSLRNRYVDQQNEVLLDENLLEDLYESPICVDEHTKATLTLAVWNDSFFLSSLNVMDYSLVVGIDSENNELVMGIVGSSPSPPSLPFPSLLCC